MIIGSILETSVNTGASQTATLNGCAMIIFYTMSDAVSWAELQSARVIYGTDPSSLYTLCSVINTDSDTKRWWYGGVEYTG